MDGWSVAIQHEGHSFVQMNVRIIDRSANLLPTSEANGLPSGFFKRVCVLLMMPNPHKKSICVLFWTVLFLLHCLYCRRNSNEFLRTRKKEEDAAKFGEGGWRGINSCVPVSCYTAVPTGSWLNVSIIWILGQKDALSGPTAYRSLHKSKTKSHTARGYGSGSGDSSIWFMALLCPFVLSSLW